MVLVEIGEGMNKLFNNRGNLGKKIIIVLSILLISFSILFLCQCSRSNPDVINYYNELNEYKYFYSNFGTITEHYGQQITDIANKLNQSNDTEEMCSYYVTLLELYTNYYNECVKIKTPSIANNAMNYHISLIQLQITRMSNLVNWCNGSNPDYDMEKDSEILTKITDTNSKSLEEFEKADNYFNQKAEKLGLEKPF